MTIDVRCAVCKNPDRRRMVEASWNVGLSAEAISRVLGGTPSGKSIIAHLKAHADGSPAIRQAEVDTRTVRERITELQEMQLNEVERRIALAKQRADELNANIDKLREMGAEGADDVPYHDWSEFFDILHKDAQAAINTILKSQGLTDKRELKEKDLKLGLFEAMAKNGLAPKAISGAVVPQLPPVSPDVEQDEVVEHD